MEHVDAFRDSIHTVIDGAASALMGNPLALAGLPFSILMAVHDRNKTRKSALKVIAAEFLEARAREIELAWRGELRRERRRMYELLHRRAQEIYQAAEEGLRAAQQGAARAAADPQVAGYLAQLNAQLHQLDQLEGRLGPLLRYG